MITVCDTVSFRCNKHSANPVCHFAKQTLPWPLDGKYVNIGNCISRSLFSYAELNAGKIALLPKNVTEVAADIVNICHALKLKVE